MLLGANVFDQKCKQKRGFGSMRSFSFFGAGRPRKYSGYRRRGSAGPSLGLPRRFCGRAQRLQLRPTIVGGVLVEAYML